MFPNAMFYLPIHAFVQELQVEMYHHIVSSLQISVQHNLHMVLIR